MKNNALTKSIEADLSLDAPFIKGQNKPISNCWHFCTDGDSVQCMFYDEQDFIDGMNRIYVISRQYKTTILAFVLMDTHVHFVLHGEYDECKKFTHEYVRRTSQYLENKRKLSKAMLNIRINSQRIDNDNYLKTVICYVCKNPVAAGLPFTFYDYPWSSAPLYFRTRNWWTEPRFCDQRHIQDYDSMAYSEKERLLKTRNIKSINSDSGNETVEKQLMQRDVQRRQFSRLECKPENKLVCRNILFYFNSILTLCSLQSW